jgi:hypothetical protein
MTGLGKYPGIFAFRPCWPWPWTVMNLVALHLALVSFVLLSIDMYGQTSGVD